MSLTVKLNAGKEVEIGLPPYVANPAYIDDAAKRLNVPVTQLVRELGNQFSGFGSDWPDPQPATSASPLVVEIEDLPALMATGKLQVGNDIYPLDSKSEALDLLAAGEIVEGDFATAAGETQRLKLVPLILDPCKLPDRLALDANAVRDIDLQRGLFVPGHGLLRVELTRGDLTAALRRGHVSAQVIAPGGGEEREILIDLVPSAAVQQSSSQAMVMNQGSGGFQAAAAPSGRIKAVPFDKGATSNVAIDPEVGRFLSRAILLHVPIEQEWKLIGYSRGALLNTFSLAPQEQLTIEVFSWDRKTNKSQTQTGSELESGSEVSNNNKNSYEAVLDARSNNGWSAGVNASVTIPKVNAQLGGDYKVNSSTDRQNRRTAQRINEQIEKSTFKMKSTTQTKVELASEFGREQRVTRRITNPNMGRVMHLDCFEVLANYAVETRHRFDKATLCIQFPFDDPLKRLQAVELKERCQALLGMEELIYEAVPERLRTGFASARLHLAYLEICAFSCDSACNCSGTTTGNGSGVPAAAGNLFLGELEAALQRMKTAIGAVRGASGFLLANRVGLPKVNPGYLGMRAEDQAAVRRDWHAYLYRSVVLEGPASSFWSVCVTSENSTEDTATLAGMLVEAAGVTAANILNGVVAYASLGARVLEFLTTQAARFGANLPFMMPYIGFDDLGLDAAFRNLKNVHTQWREAENAMKQPPAKTEDPKPEEPKRRTADAAFSPEALARAAVDVSALCQYLVQNRSRYRGVIWNAMAPSDRLRYLGIFGSGAQFATPEVVGFIDDTLLVEVNYANMPEADQWIMEAVKTIDVEKAGVNVSIPVSGVTMQSRVAPCDSLESYLVESRQLELARLEAMVRQERIEAERREKRLGANNLDDPVNREPVLRIETVTPPTN
jgi:hypothetical protein